MVPAHLGAQHAAESVGERKLPQAAAMTVAAAELADAIG
ncbi:hypothetical protein ThrDRAFT_01601 [Frankia casuarinae]|nr:hypothetical protein CcI6DRAFT_02017 [Frankia sp. CcI6]EYT92823.1 hypothetical protein ThrDRAFT_01601 [Frankia casuarinae]KDA43219.1 hypothetical protein BMG523Draft_01905 [Frankia sp. BMG5.23]OAA30506.1 hypothetical protein AAY23_100771 [Frankia casuarinae]